MVDKTTEQTWFTIETTVDGGVRLAAVTVRFTARQVTVSAGTNYERRFPIDVWHAQQRHETAIYGVTPADARDRFVARLKRDLVALDDKRARMVRQLATVESVRLS